MAAECWARCEVRWRVGTPGSRVSKVDPSPAVRAAHRPEVRGRAGQSWGWGWGRGEQHAAVAFAGSATLWGSHLPQTPLRAPPGAGAEGRRAPHTLHTEGSADPNRSQLRDLQPEAGGGIRPHGASLAP